MELLGPRGPPHHGFGTGVLADEDDELLNEETDVKPSILKCLTNNLITVPSSLWYCNLWRRSVGDGERAVTRLGFACRFVVVIEQSSRKSSHQLSLRLFDRDNKSTRTEKKPLTEHTVMLPKSLAKAACSLWY